MSRSDSSRPSEPYLADPDVTLWQSDALEVLRELPDESVHYHGSRGRIV